jgi:hypothetical protein
MIKLVKQVRPDLTLILGENAIDLFDYLDVDYLHSLTRSECIERIAIGGTYIDGMCNEFPDQSDDSRKYYLFLNKNAFETNKNENFGLVFHESTHYHFRKYWDDLQEREEQLITESEILAIDICRIIF